MAIKFTRATNYGKITVEAFVDLVPGTEKLTETTLTQGYSMIVEVSYKRTSGAGSKEDQFYLDCNIGGTSWTAGGTVSANITSKTYAYSKQKTQTYTRTHSNYWDGPRYTIFYGQLFDSKWSDTQVKARRSFTVSYNANGGTGAPGSQTKWYDETLTLSSTRPTRSGYTFTGWSGGYQPGGSYTANSALSLTAQWNANTATVIFDGNGGSSSSLPDTRNFTYNTSITPYQISRYALTKTGYHTDSTDAWITGGTKYQEGKTYAWSTFGNLNAATKVTRLYANWKPNTYQVIFNKAAARATGTTPNQNMTYNVFPILNANGYSRTGYTFLGWSNTSTGGVNYVDRYNLNTNKINLSTGADKTLYAVWQLNVKSFAVVDLVSKRCTSTGEDDDTGQYANVSFRIIPGSYYEEDISKELEIDATSITITIKDMDDNTVATKSASYTPYTKTTDTYVDPKKIYYIPNTYLSYTKYEKVEIPLTEDIDTYYEETRYVSELLGDDDLLQNEEYNVYINMNNGSAHPQVSTNATDTISKSYFVIDVNADGSAIGLFEPAPDNEEGLYVDKEIITSHRARKSGIRKNVNETNLDVGWDYGTNAGSGLGLRSSGYSTDNNNGSFYLFARDSSKTSGLTGRVDGTLEWTENLYLKNPNITRDVRPSSDQWITRIGLCDKNGALIGYLRTPFNADGKEGIQLETIRTINGSNIYNGLNLYIDANGNPIVNMNYPAAWRTALGLGSMATINSPVPLTNGGTGANNAASARTNLGLGGLATKSSVASGISILDKAQASAAINANAQSTTTVTFTVPANYQPCGVCAVRINNASGKSGQSNILSQGFDLDGYNAGGTATVYTYWRNISATNYAAGNFNVTVQIVCVKTAGLA